MSKPFQFKEFSIEQDRCAMKIGTDGVLLGAWADQENAFSILDIGAGTGVISLMLAQRSAAEVIDAIEIDDEAYEQCVENFEASDWGDRLFCYHASLQEFIEEIEDSYDLIVSNPPFYTDTYQSEDKQRNKARFEDSMPFEHLFLAASKLLSPQGKFAMIAPFKEEKELCVLAKTHGLFLNKACHVKGTETSDYKRSLLEFSFTKTDTQYTALTIEIARHEYTPEYIALVKDFYLKM
ncbi:tRNA1(Val) (adenine(37)-N6)-methyltransferase [Flavicella sediminum]|uniref:tRNA1(Val) (adenine(37)-N6)-methyltransferase n=1 Tax=Flavicella sediminum TaxID=2585141 RepID=UPI00111CE275|nr:methyltransferase [Flavicella sediminum]